MKKLIFIFLLSCNVLFSQTVSVDTNAIQALAVTSAKVATSVANTGRNVAFSMIFGSYQ